MTDLTALDELMAKYRERLIAQGADVEDDRIAEVRNAIESHRGGITADSVAALGAKIEADKQRKAIASPQGLRRLFPGLR